MSFNSRSGCSSPDPLAASQNGSSPFKARGRRTSTPRKPLSLTTGNQQAHEFSVTTPDARRSKGRSPSKSRGLDEPSESPWHIRITVQAEQAESRGKAGVPNCSPSKIFSEKTFTTKVPLKAGDETSPSKKKVKGTPRKRRSTPIKARSPSKAPISGTPELNTQSPMAGSDMMSPSVPKRGRGRPRKSTVSVRSSSIDSTKEEDNLDPYPQTSPSKRTSNPSAVYTEGVLNDRNDEGRRLSENDDEHREFDSILESEGFSMVSVSSLPSARTTSGNVADPATMLSSRSAYPSKRNITPSLAQHSPIPPPPPRPATVVQASREIDKPTTGTPRLARVVRAGIALQGVLSPVNRGQGSRQSSSQLNSPSPLSAKASPKERLDDLFSGFGPGTRRELRAGLRLGEELAKRQYPALRSSAHLGAQDNEDVFNPSPEVQYPQLPGTDVGSGYSLKVPGSAMTASSSFINTQLPSPAGSEADTDDDRMSWKYDTLPQRAGPQQPTTEPSKAVSAAHEGSSSIDRTMMEREAEWQREREAISKQIQDANSSQVIIINSDDEEEDDDGDTNPEKADVEDDGDIWQEEAQSSYTSQATSDTPPIFRQTEAPKPRRSQLPSPWMRKSRDISEITRPHDNSELFDQARQSETPSEQSSVQRSVMITPAHVAKQRKQSTSRKSDRSLFSGAVDNDQEASSDQELDSGDSLVDDSDLESHFLSSQQSMQHDTIGPLDEGTELDSNITTSTIDMEEEVPQPQTPLPQTSTPKPKTPKQVRFSEEALRPRLSELPAPETAPLPPTQPSWFSRVTSLLPTWSTTAAAPAAAAIPLPSRPKRTIRLSELDKGPLPLYMPWTKAHWWALIHIVRQSQANPSMIPAYTSKMASARYLGSVVSVNQWSKTITKQDCAVCEQFLEVLRKRGTISGMERAARKGAEVKLVQWGKIGGQFLDLDTVVSAVVAQWACDVQDGVVGLGWGDKAGLKQKQGGGRSIWGKGDLEVDGPRVEFVL